MWLQGALTAQERAGMVLLQPWLLLTQRAVGPATLALSWWSKVMKKEEDREHFVSSGQGRLP